MAHKILLKCRVCLDDFEEGLMFDLFKNININSPGSKDVGTSSRLSEKVEYCCGVKLRDSSEMPTKICRKCFDITRIWFNFRQMCVNSQVYLESFLCKDREEADCENEYLEFLCEDLQEFRAEARSSGKAWDIDNNDMCSGSSLDENATAYVEEDYLEGVLLETDVTDKEFEQIIDDIKTEKNQELESDMEHDQKRKDEKPRNKKFEKSPHANSELSVTYMCSVCGNVYTKKSAFAYHMAQHSNHKPHECELCGKAFRQRGELRNHIRRHTGEKPFKCSFCDRKFVDRSEQLRHERVHTNARPYVCKVCEKSFSYSAILKNHMKLHSGEKEFNCLVCAKAFTLQHQLKAHLNTMTHKQKEEQFVTAGYEVIYE